MEQYTEYWLKMKVLTHKLITRYGYKNISTNHSNSFFGKIELQKLTIKGLIRYCIYIRDEKDLDMNIIIKYQDLFEQILKATVDEEKIFKYLMDKMDLFEVKVKDREVYNSNQLKELFRKLKSID